MDKRPNESTKGKSTDDPLPFHANKFGVVLSSVAAEVNKAPLYSALKEKARLAEFIHPQKVKLREQEARAQELLTLLEGLPFSDASDVLARASEMFDRSKDLLFENSVFSRVTSQCSAPKDLGDRP
ncbi:hypothetical protein E8K88_11850 [Lampropedia aestuarii]|uniref:Uncharacterized protein n=1 Tax=Lampropedia aestuarii TaxID=2562762 RepID=A0A4S5BRB8_9BURK|nr:hypothetical protein [Lampropedia aestuarii]THJ32388.1 hypothetical protein E8K88_11850 [Lampropedia aestuarii]